MKRAILGLLISCLCLGLFSQTTIPKRTVVIGGDADYPPYEYINSQGLPDGYNVELSREIAKVLNWEPVFRMGKWALVMDWLQDGSIDVVQGMAFSVERAKTSTFSSAHTITWRAIFVRKGSNILSANDIMNKSVAIQQDDVAGEYLKQQGFTGTLSQLPSQEIALKLLNNGDFDACIANFTIGMYVVRELGLQDIKVLPQRIHQRDYCFASLDPQLISHIDEALHLLSKNGTLDALHAKWFDAGFSSSGFSQSLPVILIVVSILFVLMLSSALFLYRGYNQRKRRMELELQELRDAADKSQKELNVWREDFARGPVVLYKCAFKPFRVIYISQNVTKWGISPEEALAEDGSFRDLIFSEDREYVLGRSQSLLVGEEAALYYRVVNKAGEMCWVLDFCRLMPSPGTQDLCLYGYLIDITDQKKLEAQNLESKEKAEAANIAKSHFLANMSHEIRTPLNGITGFLQVLMQMEASDQQREIFDIMYSSSRNLLKIINDILDFSKIESGKMELMISDFNLRYLVSDIIKQFDHQIKREGLVMGYSIEESIPDVLKGDQLRLKQILINLMQNAVKFTERGKIEIITEVYTRSDTEIRLLIRVKDSGIGINPTKQQDIFDNYTQADVSITSKYGGTGLGLAIVKRLVELMHGFIWVESESGKGSCFFIILPFATYDEIPEQAPVQEHFFVPSGSKLRGRILLVEDERINQIVTIRQLQTWGLQVDLANNGAEALSMHSLKPYDLILMDIQMPVMDGITATAKIRDQEIGMGIYTPIIAFTASALLGDRERFLAAGMDEYIAKPIDAAELFDIISRLLPDSTTTNENGK
jgi:CheY-like chemotaxis protein/ABC-type amino acid transport substrate-binding protein/nitrogen-specific signal transduction histidine kinase